MMMKKNNVDVTQADEHLQQEYNTDVCTVQ